MASKNSKRVNVNKQIKTNFTAGVNNQVQKDIGSKWVKKIIGNRTVIVNNGAYEIERYPYGKKNKQKK